MARRVIASLASAPVVAVLALSCSTGPPLDPKLRPEGSGWFCWEQQGGTEKECRRTAAECESNRERRLRFRGGVTFSNCERGPETVHCFSFLDKAFGRRDYTCAPTSSQCSDRAAEIRKDPSLSISIVEISGCDSWR